MSDLITLSMQVGGVRHAGYCQLYVIDAATQTITYHPAGERSRREGYSWRTPVQQARMDKAFTLREAGMTYAKIGAALKVTGERARQLVIRAQQERAMEVRDEPSA